jgi:hypothetical protein
MPEVAMPEPAAPPAAAAPARPAPRPPHRDLAPAIAAGTLLLLALGWLSGGAGRLPVSIVALALSPLHGGIGAVLDRLAAAGALQAARLALLWDFPFIALYAAVLGGLLAWLAPPGVRRAPRLAAVAAAAALDVLENLLLLRAVAARLADPHASPAAPAALACAAAAAKLLLLALAVLWALRWWRTDLEGPPPASLAAWRAEVARWSRDLGEALRPIWFHLAFVAGSCLALVQVSQAQDVIRRVAEEAAADGAWPAVALAACSLLLAWCSWYWARLLLTVRFRDEQALSEERPLWFLAWVPRLLALAVQVGVAAALWTGTFDGLARARSRLVAGPGVGWRRSLVVLGALELLLGLLLFLVLVHRRRWAERGLARAAWASRLGLGRTSTADHRPAQRDAGEVARLPGTWLAAGASLAVALALVAGFAGWPVGMGALLSSASCILLAGAAWIPAGSALSVLGRWGGFRAFRWLVALVLAFSLCNDNHRLASAPADAAAAAPRPAVEDRLASWLERIHRDHPGEARHRIYLVAAEGGGIRAAYWTAAVLDRLERESRGAFSERLFAVSSVSGGSLGAAVFAAQLADGTPPLRAEEEARAFLGADHLAPVLGSLLFPEVAQKLLPVPVFPDRARALERSWEEGWARASGAGGRGRLAAPLVQAFAAAPGGRELPVLLLNATRVETGTRIIASNSSTREPFGEIFPDATDAFALAEARLPASAAAHLSARFPYVSPAAAFEGGHVVDGGYFDGIGAATLLDLLALLRRLGDAEPGHQLEPYVLLVTNGDSAEARPPPLVQLFAPLQALLQASSARSVWTAGALRAALAAAGGRCLQLGVRQRDVPLPLGWMLSSLAQRQLSADVDGVGWDTDDGPRCGGPGGDPAAGGELECSCEELATRPRG